MEIKFKPWIGSDYRKGEGCLCLGDSHYCANPSDAHENLTIEIIKDLYDPCSPHEPYKNTYTKFAKAMTGKTELTAKDKERFWNSVSFYNYVQFPISGARVSPTLNEYRDSKNAFFEVLELVRPKTIIVWGTRLYNNLPTGGNQAESIQTPDNKWIETWTYYLKDCSSIRVIPITHPSAAFSPEYWHKIIFSFIQYERY